MRTTEVLIKQAVLEAAREERVNVAQVLLFGSRARQEADPQSDWDVLVVVHGELNREALRRFFLAINRHLVAHRIPADILIRTEEQMRRAQAQVFSIEKIALREGVAL